MASCRLVCCARKRAPPRAVPSSSLPTSPRRTPPLGRAGALARRMFLPPIHLGLLYNELGRKEAAIRSVEAAVVTSGRHPWTLCALGVCYSSVGKVAEVEAIRDELTARARREYVQ